MEKLLYLPAFLEAIENDPDLSSIPSILLPQFFYTLFVVTGCEYTFFFIRLANKITSYRYTNPSKPTLIGFQTHITQLYTITNCG